MTWRNDNVSLATALKASGDRTGYATAAQRAASDALKTSVQDTLNLSQATLDHTQSAQKAAGVLQREIDTIQSLGIKGGPALELLQELKAAEDALYNKTIHRVAAASEAFSAVAGRLSCGNTAARGGWLGPSYVGVSAANGW